MVKLQDATVASVRTLDVDQRYVYVVNMEVERLLYREPPGAAARAGPMHRE